MARELYTFVKPNARNHFRMPGGLMKLTELLTKLTEDRVEKSVVLCNFFNFKEIRDREFSFPVV